MASEAKLKQMLLKSGRMHREAVQADDKALAYRWKLIQRLRTIYGWTYSDVQRFESENGES